MRQRQRLRLKLGPFEIRDLLGHDYAVRASGYGGVS
jgi:hypothetical protein